MRNEAPSKIGPLECSSSAWRNGRQWGWVKRVEASLAGQSVGKASHFPRDSFTCLLYSMSFTLVSRCLVNPSACVSLRWCPGNFYLFCVGGVEEGEGSSSTGGMNTGQDVAGVHWIIHASAILKHCQQNNDISCPGVSHWPPCKIHNPIYDGSPVKDGKQVSPSETS